MFLVISIWSAILMSLTHVACFVGGAVLAAVIQSGRLLPRRVPVIPTVRPPLTASGLETQREVLASSGLVNPNFSRTEYVDDVRNFPLASTHKVEFAPAGEANKFQGKVVKDNGTGKK